MDKTQLFIEQHSNNYSKKIGEGSACTIQTSLIGSKSALEIFRRGCGVSNCNLSITDSIEGVSHHLLFIQGNGFWALHVQGFQ